MMTVQEATKGACCDNPQPRILETTGRLYCGSCRRYLDKREPPAQGPLPDAMPAKKVPG